MMRVRGATTVLWNFGTLSVGGGRAVAWDLLEELARADRTLRHVCLVDRRLVDGYAGPAPEIVERSISSWVHYALSDQIALPRLGKRLGARAIVSLASIGPWRVGVPHGVFIQNPFVVHSWEALKGVRPDTVWYHRALSAYAAPVLRNSRSVVVQTNAMRDALIARWKLPPDKVSVIRGSISNEIVRALAKAPRGTSRKGAEHVLVTASNDGPHKNLDIIPATASALKKEGVSARFLVTIPSFSGAAKRLRTAAKALAVEDQVEFVGWVDVNRMAELLRRANAAFLPSVLESMGLPYMEAEAAGLPVIAADHECAREVCQQNGTFFDPQDPQSAARAVRLAVARPHESPLRAVRRTAQQVVAEFVEWAGRLAEQQDD